MSITEVLKDTSKKYINKNIVGDTVVPGIMIGIVVENNNNQFPGMVKVKIPTRDKNRNILQWMKVVTTMAGKSWGLYCIPEIDDEVVIAFENGNINNAYIIGSIYKNNSNMLDKNYTDENYKKSFLTKGKNQLLIDDETDKQKIIVTTNKGHEIKLDDGSNIISISDKDKKNMVEMNTENGSLKVNVDNKMTIEVNGIKIDVIGDSGKISITCDSLNINADQNINVKAQTIKVKATTLDMSATTSATLASDGIAQIKGTVKLG